MCYLRIPINYTLVKKDLEMPFKIWGCTGGVGGMGLMWVYPQKIFLSIHEGILNNALLKLFLLNNFSLFLNLNLFPPLSATPHPLPGVNPYPHKDPLA